MYSFDFTHGSHPNGPLVQGSDGNFYGTTSGGGSLDGGVVFKLTPAKVLTVLYNFNAKPGSVDGSVVDAGIIQAIDGNFYGVTDAGGTNGFGIVYKITSTGVYSVLYNLVKATGSVPETTLRQHTSGKFYGETNAGGANSLGALFSFDMGLKPFVSELPTSGKVAKSTGILGSGFTGTTDVNFNGTSATYSVVSDTYISATVPSGAGTGFISVVTPGGTLKSNLKFRVTPTVTSFSPTSGPVGTQVTHHGNQPHASQQSEIRWRETCCFHRELGYQDHGDGSGRSSYRKNSSDNRRWHGNELSCFHSELKLGLQTTFVRVDFAC